MGRSPCCAKVGLFKGPWTVTEDILLTKYIEYNGQGDWRNLPQRAGLRRCGKSCRLRWLNYLRPFIKRGNIAPDEEDLIIRLHRLLGNRWSLIAGRLPGRTDNEIKNYWNSHLSKKLRMAGIDPLTHKPLVPHHYNSINPTVHGIQAAHLQQNIDQEIITDSPSTMSVNAGSELLPSSSCNAEIISTTQVAPALHFPLANRFISFPPNPYYNNTSATMGDILEEPEAVTHNLEEDLPYSKTSDGLKESSFTSAGDEYQHGIINWMQQCYNDDEEYNGFNSVELQNIFQEYSGLLEHDRCHDLESTKVQLGDCAVRGQGDDVL